MTTPTTLPELLCPAGDMARLETALLYGADACYLGGTAMSLRAGTAGFTWDELDTACSKAHAANAKLYFTLNVLPYEQHLSSIQDSLERLADSAIDGLIIADPGVMRMAKRLAPAKEIHLSTQANTANSEAVGFWSDLGIKRVNIARELGARQMRQLVKAYPQMDFEVFVHGAMCLALSGRCLLSAWLNQRPANLGECTHPCRFDYRGVAAEPFSPEDMTLRVDERTRPDEVMWELSQEEGFSRFWAPDDLCLIKYLRWFTGMGIASLKIEGRMKTPSYVAHVVDAYRTALDDIQQRVFRLADYQFELGNTASRRLSTGFFLPEGRRVNEMVPKEQRRPIVAQIVEQTGDTMWRVAVRSSWKAENDAEIMVPGMKRPSMPAGSYSLENHKGEAAGVVHPGTEATLRTDSPEIIPHLTKGLFIRANAA